MVPDRQKVRTDRMDGRTHGRRQNYIPPTSSGDNNVLCATSKASDQPAHMCSLIKAFASRLNIQ